MIQVAGTVAVCKPHFAFASLRELQKLPTLSEAQANTRFFCTWTTSHKDSDLTDSCGSNEQQAHSYLQKTEASPIQEERESSQERRETSGRQSKHATGI